MLQVSISIDVPDLAEGEVQPRHRYHVIATCSHPHVISTGSRSTEESEANEAERSDTSDNFPLNNRPQSR